MSQDIGNNRQEYDDARASLFAALEDAVGDNESAMSEFQPQALNLKLPWNIFYPPRGLEAKLVRSSTDASCQTLLMRKTVIRFRENIVRASLLKISEEQRNVIASTLIRPLLSILERVEKGCQESEQRARRTASPMENQRRYIRRWLEQIVRGDLENAFAGDRSPSLTMKKLNPLARTPEIQRGFAGLLQDWQARIERDDPAAGSFLDGVLPEDVRITLDYADPRNDPSAIKLRISAEHIARTKAPCSTHSKHHHVEPLIGFDLFEKPVRASLRKKLNAGVPREKIIDKAYLKKNERDHSSWSASLINALQTSERAAIAEYVLAEETRMLEWLSGVASADQDGDAFDFLDLEHQCSIIRDGRIAE